MTINAQTQWQDTPEAIALLDNAWSICGHDDSIDFPEDIEAELEALCDGAYLDGGECVVSAWDLYVTARQADESRNVAWAVAA